MPHFVNIKSNLIAIQWFLYSLYYDPGYRSFTVYSSILFTVLDIRFTHWTFGDLSQCWIMYIGLQVSAKISDCYRERTEHDSTLIWSTEENGRTETFFLWIKICNVKLSE
jgi:hypothetical protein